MGPQDLLTANPGTDILLTPALQSVPGKLELGDLRPKKRWGTLDKEWHYCPCEQCPLPRPLPRGSARLYRLAAGMPRARAAREPYLGAGEGLGPPGLEESGGSTLPSVGRNHDRYLSTRVK